MTDDDYLEIMRSILVAEPCANNSPNDPSLIMDRLYLGSQRNAETWPTLEKLGVTHVLNCAGFKGQRSYEGSPYDNVGIVYLEFQADDHDSYDITRHFNEAFSFIDRARQRGGVVLVHCALGINRSGATCIAYLMIRAGVPLLKAVRLVKNKRRVLLSNRGFQKRLVKFAKKHGLLDDLTDNGDLDDLRKFIRKKILNKPRSCSVVEKPQEEDIDAFIERCRQKKGKDDFNFLGASNILNSIGNSNYDVAKFVAPEQAAPELRDDGLTNSELIFRYRDPHAAPRRPVSLYDESVDTHQNGSLNYQPIGSYRKKMYAPIAVDYPPIQTYQTPPGRDYQPIVSYQPQSGHDYQPIASYQLQSGPDYQPIASYQPQSGHEYQPIAGYQPQSGHEYQPIVSYQPQPLYEHQPTTTYYQQATHEHQPINSYKQPVVIINEPHYTPPVVLRHKPRAHLAKKKKVPTATLR